MMRRHRDTYQREMRRLTGLSPGRERRYRQRLAETGLTRHLEACHNEFAATVRGITPRGSPYDPGAVPPEDGARLYLLVRQLRPEVIVETGVCNGFSTAYLLEALADNDSGRLISIDFPEFAGPDPGGEFWEGKGGAVVPAGREPGWVIPTPLRDRWELVLGRSQDRLPEVLARVAPIDLFLHDSEHSYECMTFEFTAAYEALRPGGVLLSDDVGWNDAFGDFARRHGLRPYLVGPDLGALQKR